MADCNDCLLQTPIKDHVDQLNYQSMILHPSIIEEAMQNKNRNNQQRINGINQRFIDYATAYC